ncbi:Fe-Mn family superoxide dismutase [Clostridium felsineum]|uniref:superoxide dismutase n=1 Tax=Clostridium felsineum TaxID=36839 RepID=A0A1S8L3U2_9CLOT|nr:Fe-Mn family superoxide dismutase [Clostridium felsineum]MCR3760348.1 Fe-Mn family superoxide dismutase [Clostridium felsineum]URZ07507.1 Superoxide dismutase [Fe] [Clostridium felsineum]URZ12538.1 Superoxide dismutase [Fe] [Clostridium felsineum]
MIRAKTYNFHSLTGFNPDLIKNHYKIYTKYINDLNKIWNTNYTPYFKADNFINPYMHNLKLEEIYSINGIKLHELYFENLTGKNTIPYGPILNEIEKQFSSYENFISSLSEVALSMKGWVTLYIDSLDSRLHLFGSDFHDTSAILSSHKLLVLDVHNHSYYNQDKKEYLGNFINNLDWKVLNNRFKFYLLKTRVKRQ